ncbi:MAG: hypothetical protein QHI48_05720 [Bacteroidota bacterium]|nr:hypothetical protein [Bacteroidota bacterium]
MDTTRKIGAFLAVFLTLAGAGFPPASGQDVSDFTVQTGNDLFLRETQRALASEDFAFLPSLDCSFEYIRRFENRDITYRRGPIPLRQTSAAVLQEAHAAGGNEPVSAAVGERTCFVGSMLVDLPRPGEASGHVSSADEYRRYLLRVSIVPLAYQDARLTARVLLERAVVSAVGREVTILQNEVFGRTVDITGNEPLYFDLPNWEPVTEAFANAVPPSLEEALLITLETPRHFGFSRNVPEPFGTSTRISYAVPTASIVKLSIAVNGVERVIDRGRREAGTYHVQWTPGDIPDGVYTARLNATDSTGKPLYDGGMEMTKDRSAGGYTPPRLAVAPGDATRFIVSTESGLAFQFPVDRKKSLRHMFTHVAVRVGYRLMPSLEVGVGGGQDSFHEYPAPNVDVERISDYGGVVAYTYGYVGPYARYTFGSRPLQPFAQAAVFFSDYAPIGEIGAGVRMRIFRNVTLHIAPTVVAHFKSTVSAKVGLQYGMGVLF